MKKIKDEVVYDTLTINYGVFTEEGIVVLTVSKGDKAVQMFQGEEATDLYLKLSGVEH